MVMGALVKLLGQVAHAILHGSLALDPRLVPALSVAAHGPHCIRFQSTHQRLQMLNVFAVVGLDWHSTEEQSNPPPPPPEHT
jgi:hypothetical protein